MIDKRLDYDRSKVVQQTGWWCGPAAVETVLQAKGIHIPEAQIAADIEQIENPGRGDDKDGTDYIGLIEQYLDRKVPEAKYTSVYMPDDPPKQMQKDRLWRNLTQSIDAGWGVVVNIVAPPRNPPRAVRGSTPPPYPRHLTTFHYACLMGYYDDGNPANRATWWADSAAFGGITGWWGPFDGPGSVCTLIPPKGYCYADVVAVQQPPSSQSDPVPQPAPEPTAIIRKADWDSVWLTHIEYRAIEHTDLEAVSWLVAAARDGSNDAKAALVRLESVNPTALQDFIAKG